MNTESNDYAAAKPLSLEDIPVIDLEPLLQGEGINEVAEQLMSAALNTGFFYIRNHGIDQPGQLQQMQKLMLKYSDLPMDLENASLVMLVEELGHGRTLSTDQRSFRKKDADNGSLLTFS